MVEEPGAGGGGRADDGQSTREPENQPAGRGDRGRGRSTVARAVGGAVRRSESVLLRTYAVVATLVGGFVVLLVVLAFPRWVKLTRERGVLDRVARAMLVLVGLAVVAGLFAPLLFADRRRRAGRPERGFAHALAGYGYLLSLYLALLTSAPPGLRGQPPGSIAPVVEALYALPSVAGFAFVVLGAGLVLGVEFGLDESSA